MVLLVTQVREDLSKILGVIVEPQHLLTHAVDDFQTAFPEGLPVLQYEWPDWIANLMANVGVRYI